MVQGPVTRLNLLTKDGNGILLVAKKSSPDDNADKFKQVFQRVANLVPRGQVAEDPGNELHDQSS